MPVFVVGKLLKMNFVVGYNTNNGGNDTLC